MTEAAGSRLSLNDADAIAESLEDPRCFALLFDRHFDAICGYLSRRVGQSLAEELVGETFVRAFAGREGYDLAHKDAGPWLFGIATNLLRKHARSESRRRRAYARAVGRDCGGGDSEDLDARVDAAARGPALVAAIARLSADDRDTLLLLALTDLDYEGIAVAMAVPVGTVRSRLHRARRRLRDELELPNLSPLAIDLTERSGV
jgi:RNA polymerase sigma-70 factor, ECF subfamily